MNIRVYRTADCPMLLQLFYDTVHTVNARDYSPEQLAVWVTGNVDAAAWDRSFLQHHTLVAEEAGQVLGFGDMDADGYLDRLYVHRDFQRRGVASAIVLQLEEYAGARGVTRFTTYASITALPFFERHGYMVLQSNEVIRSGVSLTNYWMEKQVGTAPSAPQPDLYIKRF